MKDKGKPTMWKNSLKYHRRLYCKSGDLVYSIQIIWHLMSSVFVFVRCTAVSAFF